ncbi:MAG TPA: hypothetical protein VMP03_16145, partial [Methylomirabilota bacterium]|nr:hypothetical protein [Methylomirabilota bacterium]
MAAPPAARAPAFGSSRSKPKSRQCEIVVVHWRLRDRRDARGRFARRRQFSTTTRMPTRPYCFVSAN